MTLITDHCKYKIETFLKNNDHSLINLPFFLVTPKQKIVIIFRCDTDSRVSSQEYIYYSILKDFPKERYCTCAYLCNLIIRYGHLAVLVR